MTVEAEAVATVVMEAVVTVAEAANLEHVHAVLAVRELIRLAA